jgi:hypothetical protein
LVRFFRRREGASHFLGPSNQVVVDCSFCEAAASISGFAELGKFAMTADIGPSGGCL